MRIVVCVKQAVSGELNPFDASAYEMALQLEGAEVILLSMGPERTKDLLLDLTRLGAKKAYLLCDKAFAGADTLATAYALSLALKKLMPDLVICGRQTIDGDTGQTGPAISALAGLKLVANVMETTDDHGKLTCRTRTGKQRMIECPALITVEKVKYLRLPGIRSKKGEVVLWGADDIDADKSRCGFSGSPTRVIESYRNQEGRRKCQFVIPASFSGLIREIESGKREEKKKLISDNLKSAKLGKVWIVGEKCREMAEMVSDDIWVIDKAEAQKKGQVFIDWLSVLVKKENPSAVLWDSDTWSKRMAPQAAALLQTGLCADCTMLETDGERLYMCRPAFAGDITAKIICVKKPAMATIRTRSEDRADIICAMGKGAKAAQTAIEVYVKERNQEGKFRWETAASRLAVDMGMFPYEKQVGLTGKRVSPQIYLAIGISGAVHHIEGMKQAGKVIAINPDKRAPIFDFADYGVIARAEEIFC